MRGICGLLAALVLAGSLTAAAQAPALTLRLHPAELEVPAGGRAQAWVVLENGSTSELARLRLTACPDSSVEVVSKLDEVHRLAPGAMHRWTLELASLDHPAAESRCASAEAPLPLAGSVLVRLDYRWREAEDKPWVDRTVLGTLKVAERAPEAVESPVKAELKPISQALDEYRPGVLQVVVSNTSDRPIELTSLVPRLDDSGAELKKDSLRVVPREQAFPLVLQPGDVRLLAVDVRSGDAMLAGKYWVVLELGLRWRQGSRVHETTQALATEVQVGVFAESALLTAVGVPTFLLLPGFLLVAGFALLVRQFSAAPLGKEWDPLLGLKEPGFWISAVTVSILAAVAYRPVTRLAGWPRDYLRGYGIKDIVAVWAASLLLAALVFTARECVVRSRRARIPAEGDDPLVVLRKLDRRKRSHYCEQYDIAELNERLLLLEVRKASASKLWMAPKAFVEFLPQASEKTRREIESLLSQDEKVTELVELLEAGRAAGSVRIEWDPSASVKGPREVETAKLGDSVGEIGLVSSRSEEG